MKKNIQVKIYDNRKSLDRYTAVFVTQPTRNGFEAIAMSERPHHSAGGYQFCEAKPGKHLGRPIKFSQLPEECQQLIAEAA